ncbi:MAG TPA: NUDIX domain-containing protein [Patescibacteria group bacterium]|nr:NUDIX domain-containing protein [Patescibacteria group bacterium]
MDKNKRRGFDYIGVTVASLLHDGQGKFLLQKRGPEARDEQGSWDACAGALEHGETIESAIRRELKEELCAEPLDIKFIGAGEAHRTHGGKPTHWVWLLHAVQVDPKSIKIGEPHKIAEVGWFSYDNLPSPLHSQIPPALQLAHEQGIIK